MLTAVNFSVGDLEANHSQAWRQTAREVEAWCAALGVTCIGVFPKVAGEELLTIVHFDIKSDDGRPWSRVIIRPMH